jgi:hypothetical protein
MSERMSDEWLATYDYDEFGVVIRRGKMGAPPYEVPYAFNVVPSELLEVLRAEREYADDPAFVRVPRSVLEGDAVYNLDASVRSYAAALLRTCATPKEA